MNQPPFDFRQRARAAMLADHFQPDFPPEAIAEAQSAKPAAPDAAAKDLRALPWSSIDNADSRDLDQIEWAEALPEDRIRVLVAIADVSATVPPGSAADLHARLNATSVYTGGPVFPMLPERFSTDLTSLGLDQDRSAIVMEFVVDSAGGVVCADVSAAWVRNHAKLNYEQVGKWLEGGAASPCELSEPKELCAQLRLQGEAARRLKKFRFEHGALMLGDVDTVPVVVDNQVKRFAIEPPNAARDIIESFMISANIAMARYLRDQKALCLRRVVRTPKRWDRIQALAQPFGVKLPDTPDAMALGEFLSQRKKADPEHFPELSLGVLKALGPGEYVVEQPGLEHTGHFGLAVDDYTHSTAPNRRYADLIMQRLLKACVRQAPAPYTEAELAQLAQHCTEREAAARHVERLMKKVAAAALLQARVGQTFSALVTGVSDKGVYARLLDTPGEGRVLRGERGLDVGQKIQARLLSVDVERGFIDLAAV
ncbi:MAG TPA: RNB domain-containing ribonuclease [Verrucomicrobiae bacterium]|nr:RNB domain-containing ribonuclease [Verrucomicrobiae bacterium]